MARSILTALSSVFVLHTLVFPTEAAIAESQTLARRCVSDRVIIGAVTRNLSRRERAAIRGRHKACVHTNLRESGVV